MRRKPRREFFEVFRCQPPKAGLVGPKPPRAEPRADDVRSDSGRETRPATPSRNVPVSPQALVILGLLALALGIGLYALGYTRGRRSLRVAPADTPTSTGVATQTGETPDAGGDVAPSSDDPRTPTLSVSPGATGVAPEDPFHTLRIIWGIRKQSAQAITADLRKQGHDAMTIKVDSRSGYMVTVGQFPSRKGRDQTRLKDLFNAKVYKGSRLFKGCYFVRIEDTGRVVE